MLKSLKLSLIPVVQKGIFLLFIKQFSYVEFMNFLNHLILHI